MSSQTTAFRALIEGLILGDICDDDHLLALKFARMSRTRCKAQTATAPKVKRRGAGPGSARRRIPASLSAGLVWSKSPRAQSRTWVTLSERVAMVRLGSDTGQRIVRDQIHAGVIRRRSGRYITGGRG